MIRKAESGQAPSRPEGRQEKVGTEHPLDERFTQVLEGLAALQPDLRRKTVVGARVLDRLRQTRPPSKSTGVNCARRPWRSLSSRLGCALRL